MTGNALAKRTDRFMETMIDDEAVVMDLESGAFFSLSGSALSIWAAIDGSRDRDAVVATVASEYGLAGEELAADVDAFIAQLTENGFVSAG